MALHESPASMLKESLDELIEAAKFCADYRKTDKKWGDFNTGGCLGYPSAILLCSIIDSIGSYFRDNKSFEVIIDGKPEKINAAGWEHFKIVNSKYFNQKLSKEFIKQLYNGFRNNLTHNSVLGSRSIMVMNNSVIDPPVKGIAFFQSKDKEGKIIYIISISELWELCRNAIELFKNDIDSIVQQSKRGKSFH